VLAFALAACGPAQSTSAPVAAVPQPTDAPAPTAALPANNVDIGSDFPTGKFIKAGTTNYGLAFNADGTFQVFDGDNVFVHGTYKAEGNIFTETSNDGGCKTNVSFTYTFDGTNLTFNYAGSPNEDVGCSGRHTDFNNVTYTLSK
jgi:hypothetical protein